MNNEQIQQYKSKIEIIYSNFIDEEINLDCYWYYDIQYRNYEDDNYSITTVEDFGGEGMGDTRYIVIKITNKQNNEIIYIKFDGYYNSYDGTEWQEWSIVEPKEKTIIVYESL